MLPLYFKTYSKLVISIGMLLALTLAPSSATVAYADKQPAEPVNVLITINPLYMAVKEAFAENVNAQLLLPATSSPHHFSLKPSDILKIKKADMFIWVGPELEQSLIKAIARRGSSDENIFSALDWLRAKKSSRLLQVNQLRLPNLPESFPSHNRRLDDQHRRSGGENSISTTDPHFWLSKDLMSSVIEGISRHLGKRYPDKAASFEQSAIEYRNRLKSLPLNQPIGDKEFISYHNGFDYLAREAGFSIIDVMTTNTELKPGAGHLATIKAKLQSENACLITEPQFKGGIFNRLLPGNSTKIIELDPLGWGFENYSDYLYELYENLAVCSATD